MSNPFYSLPESIIIKIYEYDNTYKEIFKREIAKELWQKMWFLSNIKYQKTYNYPDKYAGEVFFIWQGLALSDCIYDTVKNIPLFYPADIRMLNVNGLESWEEDHILWMQYQQFNSRIRKCLRIHLYDTDSDTSRETKKVCYYNKEKIMFVYFLDDIYGDDYWY